MWFLPMATAFLFKSSAKSLTAELWLTTEEDCQALRLSPIPFLGRGGGWLASDVPDADPLRLSCPPPALTRRRRRPYPRPLLPGRDGHMAW